MSRSREEIEADIAALRAAKSERMLGKTAAKVGHAGGSAEFALASLSEINAELARLQLELAQVTGAKHGLGPVRVGFGRQY
ncbi:hypothetical protein [uncultured Devosia sp.]|uniref:hypothetical protein n=1 Tax=uncultured Devosia sp. TaxID=211434 RepID=UPI0026025D71|nr:hypothetical protein [uncultured Devosia sp.]